MEGTTYREDEISEYPASVLQRYDVCSDVIKAAESIEGERDDAMRGRRREKEIKEDGGR